MPVTNNDICVAFGSLRSGTTMLRLMLDGHPDIVCPGETDFLLDHLTLDQQGQWRYDLEALAADRIFKASRARLPDTDLAEPALASMVDDLRGDSKGCLVLVLHRGLERLLKLEPHIKVLHLLRDPRDVARSAIGMGWAGNVYYGARTWLGTEREWQRVVALLDAHQSLELRYEALVGNPIKVLSEICEFLGRSFDPAMLDYHGNSTYDRPDPFLIEQWRRKLSQREVGLIEPLLGDLLVKSGYEPSGYDPVIPGSFGRLKLRVEHSRSVWRRRFARYGVIDPLLVRFGGAFGFTGLARSAQARMDVITRQHLK